MATVNTLNPSVDLTVKIFSDFYRYEAAVPANEYDVVNSYFKSVFKEAAPADNFTTVLFMVSQESGIPALTLLEELNSQDQLQVTATLAYYLNGIRSLTTLVGIYQPVVPNYYTARNVLA